MKRIALFVLTNLGVMLVLGLAVNLLGLNRFLTANGLNLTSLLGFALVMGFGGAFISLLISKPMAKWTTKLTIINQSTDPTHAWLAEDTAGFLLKLGGWRRDREAKEEGPTNLSRAAVKLIRGITEPLGGITK